MGQIIGVISIALILSAIYFKVAGRNGLARTLFVLGIAGTLLVVVVMILAMYD